jgi:hypothetical protein
MMLMLPNPAALAMPAHAKQMIETDVLRNDFNTPPPFNFYRYYSD